MEKVVLVIDYSVDWTNVFRGSGVRVEQTEWRHLDLRVENGVLIADILENPLAFTRAAQQQRSLSHIDAVLVRNFPLGLRGDRFGSLCNALMISRVKCVNGALCVSKEFCFGGLCDVFFAFRRFWRRPIELGCTRSFWECKRNLVETAFRWFS
jgi:hypothetical protein